MRQTTLRLAWLGLAWLALVGAAPVRAQQSTVKRPPAPASIPTALLVEEWIETQPGAPAFLPDALRPPVGPSTDTTASTRSARLLASVPQPVDLVPGRPVASPSVASAQAHALFDDPAAATASDEHDLPPDIVLANFGDSWIGPNPLQRETTPEALQAQFDEKKSLLEAKYRLACKYQELGEYEIALIYLREIQFDDRNNPDVHAKIKEIHAQRTAISEKRTEIQRLASQADLQEWVEKLSIPELPVTRVDRRTQQGHADPFAFRQDPYTAAQLRALLDQRVSYHFLEDDLNVVMAYLLEQHNLNAIWAADDLAGQQVTLRMRNTALGDVLDYLSARFGIDYTYAGDSLVFFKADDGEAAKKFMTTDLIQLKYPPIRMGEIVNVESFGGEDGGGGGGAGGGENAGDFEDTDYNVIRHLQWLRDSEHPDWPPGSNFFFDPNFNTISLYSTPRGLKKIRRHIDEQDRPPIQVQLVVRFVTVNRNAAHAVGIDWTGNKLGDDATPQYTRDPRWQADIDDGIEDSDYENQWIGVSEAAAGVVAQGIRQVTSGTGVAGSESSMQFTGVLFDRFALSATLQAIQKKGNGHVLSAPMTIALNNQVAYLNLTREIKYIDDWEPETSQWSGDNNTSSSTFLKPNVDSREVGPKLIVRPSVAGDMKTINLEVHPHIEMPSGTFSYPLTYMSAGQMVTQSVETQQFATNEVRVRASVNDGGTLVIGGMVDDTMTDMKKEIPWLGRIPVLGNLFKSTNTSRDNQTLLIFVTANIITRDNQLLGDDVSAKSGVEDWLKLRHNPEQRARRVGEVLGDRPPLPPPGSRPAGR